MIRYALRCANGHEFEGWFSASDDFDAQKADGRLSCPVCESAKVDKQIMAPAVACRRTDLASARGAEGDAKAFASGHDPRIGELMRRIRAHVETHFDYVGDRFAQEARAMHAGEAEARSVYGEATAEEVKALVEEGVPVAPLPPAPPDKTEIN